jgi:hypothetical protein
MTDQKPGPTERLLHQLNRAAGLRAVAAENPKLEATRQQLREWQAARLARTHADLLTSPRMGRAAAFFLSDLYGSEDLTGLDANVRRIAPTLTHLLPAAALEIVAEAIELEALSEELDFAMATALGATAGKVTAAAYANAYRKIDRRADRERQIFLIERVGRALDDLVRHPLIGTTLSMMRLPAQIAGLSELQDFLQRGYKSFVKMGGADEFLNLVVSRERKLLNALFAGDDSLLGP